MRTERGVRRISVPVFRLTEGRNIGAGEFGWGVLIRVQRLPEGERGVGTYDVFRF